MQKFNVLFLCPGNSARSQLAEALLRHRAGDFCEAYSGGTDPRPLNPLTSRVLEEVGLSAERLRVKRAESLAGVAFDYVIALAGGTAWTCVANWPGSPQRLFWMFENPAMCDDTDEEPLERFREQILAVYRLVHCAPEFASYDHQRGENSAPAQALARRRPAVAVSAER